MKINLMLLLFSINLFAGQGTGNGGDVVVCNSSDGSKTYELLDLYEAREMFNFSLDTLGNQASFFDNAFYQIEKLVDNQYYDYYKIRLQEVINRTLIIVDGELEDIPDSYHTYIPPNCEVKQVAINYLNGQIRIDLKLFEKLDNVNKSALFLHELFYEDFVASGFQNSIRARYLNALIHGNQSFSNDQGDRDIAKFIMKTYNSVLKDLSLEQKISALKTSPFDFIKAELANRIPFDHDLSDLEAYELFNTMLRIPHINQVWKALYNGSQYPSNKFLQSLIIKHLNDTVQDIFSSSNPDDYDKSFFFPNRMRQTYTDYYSSMVKLFEKQYNHKYFKQDFIRIAKWFATNCNLNDNYNCEFYGKNFFFPVLRSLPIEPATLKLYRDFLSMEIINGEKLRNMLFEFRLNNIQFLNPEICSVIFNIYYQHEKNRKFLYLNDLWECSDYQAHFLKDIKEVLSVRGERQYSNDRDVFRFLSEKPTIFHRLENEVYSLLLSTEGEKYIFENYTAKMLRNRKFPKQFKQHLINKLDPRKINRYPYSLIQTLGNKYNFSEEFLNFLGLCLRLDTGFDYSSSAVSALIGAKYLNSNIYGLIETELKLQFHSKYKLFSLFRILSSHGLNPKIKPIIMHLAQNHYSDEVREKALELLGRN